MQEEEEEMESDEVPDSPRFRDPSIADDNLRKMITIKSNLTKSLDLRKMPSNSDNLNVNYST